MRSRGVGELAGERSPQELNPLGTRLVNLLVLLEAASIKSLRLWKSLRLLPVVRKSDRR